MNSITNLAKRNFRENKVKTFLTVLTVILITALLTSIGILYATITESNIKDKENTIGRFHCTFNIENDKQIQVLKNNVEIEKAGEQIYLGSCDNEELGVNRIDLKYMDKDAGELNNIQLEKGNMPQKSNEIVMSKWIIEKLNKKPELGEKVHLKFIIPKVQYTLENKEPHRGEKDFIICGILKEDLHAKKYNEFQAMVSKPFVYEVFDKKNINKKIDLRLKDSSNIEKNIYRIANNINISNKGVELNIPYISALNPEFYDMLPFMILAFVLILTATVVIYNIYYLSITQKIQNFGLLSALGATKKQMRKVIMIEGFFTCMVGIPLGIFLGYAISYTLCKFVIPSFNVGDYFVLKTPTWVILISVSVSLFTVIFALIRPARVASKISPIGAIKFNGYEVESKNKERKACREINIKKLAYLNLWRYKKRTLMTIFSLSMSAMMFIIISSIVVNMDIDLSLKESIQNDFLISSTHVRNDDGKINPLNDSFIEDIKKINGVTKVQKVNYCYTCIENSSVPNNKDEGSEGIFDFYGFNDEMLNKLKKKVLAGKISLEDLKSKNKNQIILVKDDSEKYKLNVGDKVCLKKVNLYKNNNDSELKGNFRKIYDDNHKFNEFTVSAIIDKNLEGLDLGISTDGTFISHKEVFSETMNDNRPAQLRVDIEKSKYNNVKTSLKNLIEGKEELLVKDYEEAKIDLENQSRSINIILYGLVGVITIIGVLNLINTRFTSIITRKTEIGMIESIGASNKTINKMLQLEGFYYSFISCVIAITGGLGIGYLFFILINRDAPNMVYKVPLASIIILIVIFTLLQIVITYLVEKVLNKDSIIEKIRING